MSQNEIRNSKTERSVASSASRASTAFAAVLTILSSQLLIPSAARAGGWQFDTPYPSTISGGSSISGPTGANNGLFNSTAASPIPYVYQPSYPVQNNSWMPLAMIGIAALPMLFRDEPARGKPGAAKLKYQLAKDSPTVSRKTSRRAPANIPLRNKYKQQYLSEDQPNEGTAQ
jgi:hypothetical protein